MAEGGMKCIKFLLFIFNLLFVLSGLVILITGIVIRIKYKDFVHFAPSQVFTAPIILIIVGVIIFGIAFLGCCGAIKENNCMVMMFAVLLVVILILELAAGIAAYALRGDLNELLKNTMLDTMHSYNDSNGKDITTAAWNDLQVNENCCGVTNYTDWWKPGPFEKPLLPSTCCESEQLVNGNCTEMNEFHRNGCFGVLSDSFEKNVGIVGGVGVGIAFVQVIGIVFACCLSRSIRKGYETV